MRYSRKTLAKIGKVVLQRHPELASSIVEETNVPHCDLERIPEYFEIYCLSFNIIGKSIKGPVYKSSITEKKKVFISAMIEIYHDQHGLKTSIADILEQKLPPTIRMIKEVQFRFQKDKAFRHSVNAVLSIIQLSKTDTDHES